MQLRAQCLQGGRGYRVGGDAVTRPDDERGDQQEHLMAASVMFDDAAFGQGLSLFDQHLVAAQVGLREVLERRIHRGIVARAQQSANDGCEFGFPVAVFDPAAGAVQRERQSNQAGSVLCQAGGGGGTRTGHIRQSERRKTG